MIKQLLCRYWYKGHVWKIEGGFWGTYKGTVCLRCGKEWRF